MDTSGENSCGLFVVCFVSACVKMTKNCQLSKRTAAMVCVAYKGPDCDSDSGNQRWTCSTFLDGKWKSRYTVSNMAFDSLRES